MAVEKQNLMRSSANSETVVTHFTVTQNRNAIGPSPRDSLDDMSKITLEDVESEQCSILNLAVMESACLVTKKRRPRSSCASATRGNLNEGKRASDNLENLETFSDTLLMMEKAISATRRRRSKLCENLDSEQTY